jgi:Resolvase, N terminal domain
MSDKITSAHLERVAYVYIRQSTLSQVRNNLESKRRQYELKDRARALGFERIEVIDDDLGISGTGSKERPGFARLLAAVCEGRAGAVLAFEASRLARNNRDWHHLIDLCTLTGTLVVDKCEGIKNVQWAPARADGIGSRELFYFTFSTWNRLCLQCFQPPNQARVLSPGRRTSAGLDDCLGLGQSLPFLLQVER